MQNYDKLQNFYKSYLIGQDTLITVFVVQADGLMRARAGDLRGIVNGIDYDEFNPETDKLIAQPYNARNFRKEKGKNKKQLQAQLGLPVDEKKFMVGIVSTPSAIRRLPSFSDARIRHSTIGSDLGSLSSCHINIRSNFSVSTGSSRILLIPE